MTFAINVAGGTGAGKRAVKVLASWRCSCYDLPQERFYRQEHPGNLYSCSDCGDRRPAVTRVGLELEGWDVPVDAA